MSLVTKQGLLPTLGCRFVLGRPKLVSVNGFCGGDGWGATRYAFFCNWIFATKQRCNALQSVAHIVRYLSNGDLLATKDAIKSLPKFSHNGLMAGSYGLNHVHLLRREIAAQLVHNKTQRVSPRLQQKKTAKIQSTSKHFPIVPRSSARFFKTSDIICYVTTWWTTQSEPFWCLEQYTNLIDMSCSKSKPNVTCPTFVVALRHPSQA